MCCSLPVAAPSSQFLAITILSCSSEYHGIKSQTHSRHASNLPMAAPTSRSLAVAFLSCPSVMGLPYSLHMQKRWAHMPADTLAAVKPFTEATGQSCNYFLPLLIRVTCSIGAAGVEARLVKETSLKSKGG
eukprot:scaffold118687_cov13-Tisochrysis_lutea.AAC.1